MDFNFFGRSEAVTDVGNDIKFESTKFHATFASAPTDFKES